MSESGRKLNNRFILQEQIGSGGMGDVYKALDLRQQEAGIEPYLAIKLLNEKFQHHKEAFIALQREASKARSIASNNVVQVYDFDREDRIFFMGMELLEGQTLDEMLHSYPDGMPLDLGLSIIEGFCQGLKDAHSRHIIHSDLKPGNIFYTTDKVVKVLDFGLARAVQKPGTTRRGAKRDTTVFDPMSLGALTPAYASAGVLAGAEPGESDDIFAVGLVAYEILSGKHPYARAPANVARDENMQLERIKGLSGAQWNALRQALAFRESDRMPSIERFMEEMSKGSGLTRLRQLFAKS